MNSSPRDFSDRLAKLSPEQRAALRKRLGASGSSPIQSQSAESSKTPTPTADPIAIVGVSCRFPGAPNLDAYWNVIASGIDATCEIPAERWDVDSLYDPTGQKAGRMSVRRAGMVEGIDQFDPKFFGISPREAARMDPQQRLLLEVSWEAFEIAGIPVTSLAGQPVGTYVGIGGTDYSKVPSQYDGYYQYIDAHVGTGNALSIAANRLAYIMDLRGPSMAIDTACSSSTMAVHLAVQSLRSGECDAALAGGVNAILTPETTIAFSKARMLSPDGQCRPFDADANGYVRGEGCGMLVLKRLADAERDGDSIWGVIRGSATNQDGRTSGITAPNGISQQAVIGAALREAGIDAGRVNYIEAHGTGTPLGDPIEIDALTKVFPGDPSVDRPCYVTSVKANVGHMETVSGVAGMIKLLLMMRHRVIPGQLHLNQLNPRMSLKRSRIVIPSATVDWPAKEELFVAGVSSFGFGGANTHLVLQEHPTGVAKPAESTESTGKHVVALSGKRPEAIEQVASRLLDHIGDQEERVVDVVHTMNTGRVHHAHRTAVVFDDVNHLRSQLELVAAGKKGPGIRAGQIVANRSTRTAFLFTGQGSQFPGMGRELFDTQPVFRKSMTRCDEILSQHMPTRLLDVFYGEDATGELVHQTQYTQAALFAIEYALSQLWLSRGVRPNVVLGHSVGEFAAACMAGIVTLDDGLKLIAHRGRLMGELPAGGGMTAMFAPADKIAEQLKSFESTRPSSLSIAAENGPQNTVVSGSQTDLDEFAIHCQTNGMECKPLQVSHAFHSQLMDEMLDEFRSIASQVDFQSPRIPLVSNLTGAVIEGTWSADYLCDHIRHAVRFEASMQTIADMNIDVMLEIGPSPILTGMGRRCLTDSEATWVPSMRPGVAADVTMLEALGDAHVRGVAVDWKAVDGTNDARRIMLPTYPFDRQRYWLDPSDEIVGDPSQSRGQSSGRLHPLLGHVQPTALRSHVFENSLSATAPEFLADHAVQGSVNLPGAAFMEVAFAAARQRFGAGPNVVSDASIEQAMFVDAMNWKTSQTIVDENNALEFFSRERGDEHAAWQRHLSASLIPAAEADAQTQHEAVKAPLSMESIESRLVGGKDHDSFYDLMSARRLEYGPRFRMLSRIDYSIDEAIGVIDCDESTRREWGDYELHPVLGDALMQTFSALVPRQDHDTFSQLTYMPTRVGRATVFQPPHGELRTYGKRTSPGDQLDPETVEGDVWLINEAGEVVAEWLHVRVTRIGRIGGTGEPKSLHDSFYQIAWEPQSANEKLSESLSACDGQHLLLLGENNSTRQTLASRWQELGGHVSALDSMDDWNASAHSNTQWTAIVSLWPGASGDNEDVANQTETICLDAMNQLQAVLRNITPSKDFRGWWHVTSGVQSVTGHDESVSLYQSGLWGMVRVAMTEMADLKPRLLDGSGSTVDSQSAGDLIAEIQFGDGEDQVAYRDGVRHVGRLVKRTGPSEQSAISIPKEPHRLRFRQTGSFDSLYFEPFARTVPVGDQVELRVDAAGLNFSDVLKVMGLYPGITDKVVPLGIECSGVVTAVGENVTRFQVGQPVMGVAPFSFGSHATTPEYTLVERPNDMDVVDAATIPIAFLTAWYGLVHLADVQPGERVLIHAGAGGVGLAATQIAMHLGAEVISTAGSDEKRDFLRSLGVKHVFNSRTTQFADDIRRVFGGEGIDVVLNSLPGDAIPRSLSVLNAYGRFLEIGKTDIYQDRKVGLLPFQDNLSYHAIDLDRVLRQRPAKIVKLWDELSARFAAGDLTPIACTEFEQSEIMDSFRYMAQRKNIGKVVTRMAVAESDSVESNTGQESNAKTALITGGTGAIGLQLAKRLIEDGVNHIALLSRREPAGETAQAIESMSHDANVVVLRGDVGELGSLQKALTQLPVDFAPIGHVYHAAGVLSDGLLMDMTPDQLRLPMRPKVHGAWNLHLATLDQPIETFVLFSSIAACLGSPGQANYAAANSFLDALATQRRSLGLPATSIAWGPWAGSGMASTPDREAQLAARGMRLLPAPSCLDAMENFVAQNETYVAVMDVDWPVMTTSMRQVRPFLEHFADSESGESGGAADQVDHEFRHRLIDAKETARAEMLRSYFAGELARLMGWEADQIDVAQKLSELGMDSLIAMELKNNLEQRLAITIPMSALIESPSINRLVDAVVPQFASGGVMADASESSSQSQSIIVALKPDGSRPPWLCIHPLGGSPACYSEFAKQVDSDQPVHALVGSGADGVSDPPRSLDGMMEEYVGLVQSHFATGELRLVGWSAGGVFAVELACRLRDAGRGDISITLVDTPLPSIYRNIDPDDDVQFVKDLIQFSNAFSGTNMHLDSEELNAARGTDRIWQHVLKEAQAAGVLSPDASSDMVRRLIDTSRQHVQFIKSYEIPENCPDLQLILPMTTNALEQSSGEAWTDHLDWPSMSSGNVLIERTPGDHFTMLTGGNAATLARRMTAYSLVSFQNP